MSTSFNDFTFKAIKEQFYLAKSLGYNILTCHDYFLKKNNLPNFALVNRVDVDFSIKKAKFLAEIFDELNIKATFFIRLHAPEYNVFSFENYRIIQKIISSGHEIGLHTEVLDQSAIWDEEPSECLTKDIRVLEHIFDIKIFGCACHGGLTGINNLDFFESNKASQFGLKYEAYQNDGEFNLFYNSLYVSDSEWYQWKSYVNGNLQLGDKRSLGEHLKSKPKLIYSLIHPDSYFENHIYE